MAEARKPQDESPVWEKLDNFLDRKSIPEQVTYLAELIEGAKTSLFTAHHVATKIIAAMNAGVLSEEEGDRFIETVFESVKDLRAMLVLQWSGANSEREILEQLHHIYYPQKRPDGGLANSFVSDLLAVGSDGDLKEEARKGGLTFTELMVQEARPGPAREYWKMLRDYVGKHPDEIEDLRLGVNRAPSN